jgi:hypothetical protein
MWCGMGSMKIYYENSNTLFYFYLKLSHPNATPATVNFKLEWWSVPQYSGDPVIKELIENITMNASTFVDYEIRFRANGINIEFWTNVFFK